MSAPSPTPKRKRTRPRINAAKLPILQPDAAGIDVGARELYVAVPPDRAPEPVRCFTTFTHDLEALAAWLQACGVRSVALEATGVYWIPLFQVLEQQGFTVCLVNARHLKHVTGRKTDVSDCQWLQYLHAVGLLNASFRPAEAVCAVRTVLRYRETLVTQGALQIQHLQKALTQMNLHLHHVLTDISGVSGLRIIAAILAGERDPERLAQLRDPHVQAAPETVVAALRGDWREEHLFVLRQAWELYVHYQSKLRECECGGRTAARPVRESGGPGGRAPLPHPAGEGTQEPDYLAPHGPAGGAVPALRHGRHAGAWAGPQHGGEPV